MFRGFCAIVTRIVLVAAVAGFVACIATLGHRFSGPGILLVVLVAWRTCRGRFGSGYAHGTAREATFSDLLATGMTATDHGVVLGGTGYLPGPTRLEGLGALLSPRWRSTQAIECFLAAHLGSVWGRRGLIRLGQFVHLVTFAPTGAGKSVSVLVPNLLSYVFSCVVVDPKGELYSITAGHRQRKFGHRIVLFDPFGITGREGLSFNPLAFLDSASPDFLDQCRDVANMLIVRTGKEHEPHWNDMAEVVLTCIIAFVCSSPNPDERNLQWVRDIIANPDNFAKAIGHMTKIPHLARLGHQLRWLKDEEQASVMSTLQRQTAWLDSAAIRNHSTTNDFDPLDLRRQRATVYLCLPPDRLVTLAPLMRLWIGSILRRVTQGGADERNPLLLLIDEAGHLGHIQALEDAVTLMRGYGIRLWFFFQSMGQLSKAFGERASVFLDNIDTQQYFGINAIDSADVISRRIGDATITTQSRQRSTSYSEPTGFASNGPQSGQRSTSSSVTTSEMARRLYKPEEVLRLPADMALLFHKNMPVIPARLIRYYADPEFRDGGTGRSNRLGLGTMLTSVFLLAASVFGLAFVSTVPVPRLQPSRMAGAFPGDGGPKWRSADPWQPMEPPARTRSRRRRPYVPPNPMPYDGSGFNPWLPETW